MKKLFSILFFVMAVTITMAQSPVKFNYQAVARDNTGKELNNKTLGLRISLRNLSATGTIVYQEKHTVTTNNVGLFNIKVGGGARLFGDMTTINWGNGPYFIEIEMDIDGGTNYTSLGASQLVSVPYAMYAENAGKSMKAGTGLSIINGDSIINTAPDKVVTLTGTGGINITGTYPGFTINTPVHVNQTLNYSNDSLSISNGNSVVIQSDKIVTLTSGGGTTITGTYPNFTISAGAGSINLIGSGGTVVTGSFPNYTINSPWFRNGTSVYHLNGGNVGIGTANPISRLMIRDTLNSTRTNSFIIDVKGGNVATTIYRGIYVGLRGSDGNNRAIQGYSGGFSLGTNAGISGYADSANVNIGLNGSCSGFNTNANGFNVGVNSTASNSAFSNIALGGYATNGTAQASANFGLVGLSSSATSATGTNYGIYASASTGTTNYAGYFDGNVTITGTLSYPSDITLKSDVNELNGALTILNRLHPVSYYYNREENKYIKLPENLQYGFIAQELETVLPELVKVQKHPVKTFGSSGEINPLLPDDITYKGINYIGIIPLLTKGIQEQQEQINSLKLEIEKLRTEVEKLKKGTE